MTRRQAEFKIQADAVQYLRLAYPELLFTISPAGMLASPGAAMKVIRMGYQSGTPDLMFFEARGRYFGYLIEIKTQTGTLSKEQKGVLEWAKRKGFLVSVCRSTDEVIQCVEQYLSLPPTISG